MGTSLEQEMREQARWRLVPAMRRLTLPDELVRNEFLDPGELEARARASLRQLMSSAGTNVPFYVRALSAARLSPDEVDHPARLVHLPVVTKEEVQRDPRQFQPKRVTVGEEGHLMVRTAGTTGPPLMMRHTSRSKITSTLLAQRELRWFRMNPGLKGASIGAAADLPGRADGSRIDLRETARSKGWMILRHYFETGPLVGFNILNSVEDKFAWLVEEDPAYLVSYSAELEQLAFLAAGDGRIPSLRGLHATSQQLTAGMRATVEAGFGVPVHQSYGLNEVGLVASRCPEGGRYHVHTEQCLVEVADDDGRPCGPGEAGRLLVTGFNNAAMPLIRYDSGDLGTVPDPSPCPCGRTLPAFVDIVGRYRRVAALPPGTFGYWDMVSTVLSECPPGLLQPLRQYQLHQFFDGSFELRVQSAGPLRQGFFDHLRNAWVAHGGSEGAVLEFRQVDGFPRSRGGKFQNFTSDFAPFPTDRQAPA